MGRGRRGDGGARIWDRTAPQRRSEPLVCAPRPQGIVRPPISPGPSPFAKAVEVTLRAPCLHPHAWAPGASRQGVSPRLSPPSRPWPVGLPGWGWRLCQAPALAGGSWQSRPPTPIPLSVGSPGARAPPWWVVPAYQLRPPSRHVSQATDSMQLVCLVLTQPGCHRLARGGPPVWRSPAGRCGRAAGGRAREAAVPSGSSELRACACGQTLSLGN